MKHIRFFFVFVVLLILSTNYQLPTTLVHAENMNSDRYRIQFGTVGIGGNKMSDAVDNTYSLTTTLGQAAAGQFQSNGYIMKAGFQYVYSTIPFTFSVSQINANLGTLLPNTPSTTSLNLSVSFGGANQYIVTAREDSPLKTFAGTVYIPNTQCNGGASTCTTTLAKPWTSASAYGFGYGMTGEDIPADFTDATYYRPFADLTVPQDPATVMQGNNVTEDITPTPNPSLTPAPLLTGVPRNITHQSTLTFKVNISPLQSAGSYSTVIRFVATPSF